MKRQLLTTRLSQRSDSRSSGTIVDDATLADDVTIPDSPSLVGSPPTSRRRIQNTPPSYVSVETLKWSPGDPIPIGGFEPHSFHSSITRKLQEHPTLTAGIPKRISFLIRL